MGNELFLGWKKLEFQDLIKQKMIFPLQIITLIKNFVIRTIEKKTFPFFAFYKSKNTVNHK